MIFGCIVRKSIVCDSDFVSRYFLKRVFQCAGLEVTLGL
jgi:hypothetical protein